MKFEYRSLALASVVIGDIVVAPVLVGGLGYWLSKGSPYQQLITLGAGFVGMVFGFIRVFQVLKR